MRTSISTRACKLRNKNIELCLICQFDSRYVKFEEVVQIPVEMQLRFLDVLPLISKERVSFVWVFRGCVVSIDGDKGSS